MLPSMHPLAKPVNQAARHFMKRHHSPLHELMFKFKLKPNLLGKIAATRQDPKWEPGIALRVARNKELAKDEDLGDRSHIKVYMDRSGINGHIGAVAVLYWDRILQRKLRMKLGLLKHHTVYEGEGIGMILGLELIREEEVNGMVTMGTNNTVEIGATHAIKLCPSHHIWDLFQ